MRDEHVQVLAALFIPPPSACALEFAVVEEVDFLATLATAIPTAVHLNQMRIVECLAVVAVEGRRPIKRPEVREQQLARVPIRVALVAKQDKVGGLILAAVSALLDVMVLKARVVADLGSWAPSADAATQAVAQVDGEANAVFNGHESRKDLGWLSPTRTTRPRDS